MSRRMRVQIKPNLNALPKAPPKLDLNVQEEIFVEKVQQNDQISLSPAEQSTSNDEISTTKTVDICDIIQNEKQTCRTFENEKNVVEQEIFPALEEESSAFTTIEEEDVNVDASTSVAQQKSEQTSTPILTSLLSSPSKFRGRFQIKPNLSAIERKLSVVDDTDFVGVSSLSQKSSHQPPKRRRFDGSQQLDRSLFTMADLVYWNPDNGSQLKRENDDAINNLPTPPSIERQKAIESNDTKAADILAPQLRVNADGTIVVDDSSVTIKKTRDEISTYEIVRETQRNRTQKLNSSSFRRNPIVRTKTWNEIETEKFYRILRMVGTDFSMMAEYFPRRQRIELKNKFRKECKENPSRIDFAMKNPCSVPLKVPRRLLKLANQSTSPIEKKAALYDINIEEEKDTEDEEIPKDPVDTDETLDTEEEENEKEQLLNMFDQPTRSGRVPKTVMIKKTRTKKFRVADPTECTDEVKRQQKSDDEIPPCAELVAPGPSNFPGFPSKSASSPDVGKLTAAGTPGRQILLVHEKSQQVGKPDLVHIYLVSSPNGGKNSKTSPGVASSSRAVESTVQERTSENPDDEVIQVDI